MSNPWNYGASGAPLLTVVSASGGVGKSSLALMAGWLSSRAGIRTSVIEGDLQFGDMGFWLGLDDELPDLGLGAQAGPIRIRDGLALYKAPCFPEAAEEVSEQVAQIVPRIRKDAQLVIADTGQFWSGLTAELVCSSDLVLIVVDQRVSSVVGAVKARELLERLGVPVSRCACVYNRWSGRARLSVKEVVQGTGIETVGCVPDGRSSVEATVTAGQLDELVEAGNPFAQGVDALLVDILPRVGLVYSGGSARRKGRIFR